MASLVSSRLGRGRHVKSAAAWLSAALVFSCASSAKAYDTCTAAKEKSPCTVPAGGGDAYCCVPGFVLDNDWANSGGLAATWGPNSFSYTAKYNLNNACCEALYVGIGNIGSVVVSDQYNLPGSHLPLKLQDIASLKGAWTIQVPPVKSTDIYRVYYELFLSSDSAGIRDKGNITIDFYHPNYGYDSGGKISMGSLLGYSNVQVVDYGANPNSQGPFVAFALPAGAYTPDSKSVLTVTSVDVKAVLDWAVQNLPKYYSSGVYLTELNLTQEAMTVNGTFTTTFASFEVQKTGAAVVYTPTWTNTYWSSGMSSSGSSGGSSDGGSAGDSDGGSAGSLGDDSGGPSGASSGGSSSGASDDDSGPIQSSHAGGALGIEPDGGNQANSGNQANGGGGGCSTSSRGSKGSAALLVVALGLALRRGRRRTAVASAAAHRGN